VGEDDINVRAIGEEFDARLHMRVVDHNQVAVDPDKSSESLKGRSSGGGRRITGDGEDIGVFTVFSLHSWTEGPNDSGTDPESMTTSADFQVW